MNKATERPAQGPVAPVTPVAPVRQVKTWHARCNDYFWHGTYEQVLNFYYYLKTTEDNPHWKWVRYSMGFGPVSENSCHISRYLKLNPDIILKPAPPDFRETVEEWLTFIAGYSL
jgi:hypothetical protein